MYLILLIRYIHNMMTHYQLVGEFHEYFGHPLRTTLYTTCITDDPKLIPFRISLMEEEYKECLEAIKQKDIVELADGLCDLSYVANGAGHCLGMDMGLYTNTDGFGPNATYSVDGDMFDTCSETVETGINGIRDALDNFVLSVTNMTTVTDELTLKLANILDAIYDMGYRLNFNMDLMFREVHRSNMTKLCTNEQDAIDSVNKYNEEGVYKNVGYKTKGSYYVVYDTVTSKILKCHKWDLPNLEQFMNYK